MKNTKSIGIAVMLFSLCCAATLSAQAPLEKLRLIYSAIGGSQASVWIPYETGIFRKHGLDVELLYVAGGWRAAAVVQSGEVPIGIFTGGSVISANLTGGDLVMIASSMNMMTFIVMAQPEIKRPEDLKAKKSASRASARPPISVCATPKNAGRSTPAGFAVIQVGGVTDVFNALRAGALDAAVVNAELAILARREGYRELADISRDGYYVSYLIDHYDAFYIKRNENTVRKFVRAFAEGIHFAKTQRAATINVMKKYLRSSDAAMFDELSRCTCSRIAHTAAFDRVAQNRDGSMGESDPRVANLKPEQFIDATLFQELEKEGFIKDFGSELLHSRSRGDSR